MLNLPIDIIRHIYTFESTKKDNFAKVIHQLKMRQVFFELYHSDKIEFMDFDDLLYDEIRIDDELEEYGDENWFEVYFRNKCLWHRVLGRKPRLPFIQFQLILKYYEIYNQDYEGFGCEGFGRAFQHRIWNI